MKRDGGFTLIEVLIATAVIVVAMAAIATMALTALRGVERNGERTAAVSLAQSRIEWLRNRPSGSLEEGTTVEELTGAFAGYDRTTTIETDTPRVGVEQVTVTIATPAGQTVRLATLVGRR
jgi:prepilin-type N-terminal cleavage/methylation domain-containing protein